MHHGFWKETTANAGLVCDDDYRQLCAVQAANRSGGEGKHIKLAGIIQVADFFGDGAVAIEEDRWTG
jgi:hypothetical protein